jgi:hypothetical protein
MLASIVPSARFAVEVRGTGSCGEGKREKQGIEESFECEVVFLSLAHSGLSLSSRSLDLSLKSLEHSMVETSRSWESSDEPRETNLTLRALDLFERDP